MIGLLGLLLLAEGIISSEIRRQISILHRGYCTYCGYDLRAMPLRCPECGLGGAPAMKNRPQKIVPTRPAAITTASPGNMTRFMTIRTGNFTMS